MQLENFAFSFFLRCLILTSLDIYLLQVQVNQQDEWPLSHDKLFAEQNTL